MDDGGGRVLRWEDVASVPPADARERVDRCAEQAAGCRWLGAALRGSSPHAPLMEGHVMAIGGLLRHRRWVMLTWLVIAVTGGALAPSIGSRLQSGFVLHSPGYTAEQALGRQFGGAGANPSTLVVHLPAGVPASSPTVHSALAAADSVGAAKGVRTISYAADPAPALLSPDGRSTLLFAYPAQPGVDTVDPVVMDALATAVRTALPGTSTSVTGVEQLSAGSSGGGSSSVLAEALIGGAIALLVLLLFFRSFIAVLPLLTSIVSILTMLLGINGLTRLLPGTRFNPSIEAIVAILGLGLSLDYALLVVSRWRQERATGKDNLAAVTEACRRAGHAVLVSGVTASIGLLALAIVPVSFVRGVALAGLLIPLIAALVSLTLLPAVLAAAGPWLDRPRRQQSRAAAAPGGWHRWGRLVVRRRWAALLGGSAVLLGLAGAATQINIALPGLGSLAGSGPAYQGYQQLRADGFDDGALTPLPVLVRPSVDQGLAVVKLGSATGVTGAFLSNGTGWTAADGTRIALVVPQVQAGGRGGRTVITAIRAAAPSADSVGGNEVLQSDNTAEIYSWFPAVLVLVGLVTLAFLAFALRSLVLPLKAVVLNLLSVAATFGATVLIWQYGYGSHAIYGLSSTGAINALAPILLFGFLFGLSMDYEVFVLTRMREGYQRTHDTDRAVIEGIGQTGRIITSAALVLFGALVSLSTAPDILVKIIASGLGVGILLDATVVRSVVAPAAVSLLAKANWYWPGKSRKAAADEAYVAVPTHREPRRS